MNPRRAATGWFEANLQGEPTGADIRMLAANAPHSFVEIEFSLLGRGRVPFDTE